MSDAMTTSYKDYSIITFATKASDRRGWLLTLEILNAEQQQVVGPIRFRDFMFSTESAAHEAGVVAGRYWIDGENRAAKAA